MSAVMSIRTFTAAAALAAAVSASAAVCVLMQRRCRRLAREATAQRLMAGCETRDNAALRAELLVFRRRLDREIAGEAAVAAAGLVLDDALAHSTRIDPNPEGGPR